MTYEPQGHRPVDLRHLTVTAVVLKGSEDHPVLLLGRTADAVAFDKPTVGCLSDSGNLRRERYGRGCLRVDRG